MLFTNTDLQSLKFSSLRLWEEATRVGLLDHTLCREYEVNRAEQCPLAALQAGYIDRQIMHTRTVAAEQSCLGAPPAEAGNYLDLIALIQGVLPAGRPAVYGELTYTASTVRTRY